MYVYMYVCTLLLFFSWVSSLNLLSYPGEVYSFGSVFILGFVFWPIGILIASKFYLPVFYELKVVSMFEVMLSTTSATPYLPVMLDYTNDPFFSASPIVYINFPM